MNMTGENVRELGEFDSKSRELEGQKVELKFIGFQAGQ